jgi:hypothetical protein
VDDSEKERGSDSEVIYETLLIRVKSIRTRDNIEEAIVVDWKPSRYSTKHQHQSIRLSTLLEPHQLAPLFSGIEWAGTRLWDAAIECIHYLYDHYVFSVENKQNCSGPDKPASTTKSLLELGCGLGVPGMMCSLMGLAQHVVLTDHGSMLNLLVKNVRANFQATCDDTTTNALIQAKELSWSREGVKTLLLAQERDRIPLNTTKGFDYVIACDCIFEPLYGESWMLLADVIDELLSINPKTIVLVSCERRNHDGVDKFISRLRRDEHVGSVLLALAKGKIEIYKVNGCEL